MAEKISVQIELQGGHEVEQQLENIGAAGQKAFADIGQPAQQATQSLNEVGEAGAKAKESFLEVTEQAARTGQEITKLVGEIAKYGVEIGLMVQKHKGWVKGLLEIGSALNTALRAVAAFTPELALLGTGLASIGVAAAGAAIGLEALEKAATKAASADEKLNHSLQMLAESSGQSFKSLQEGKAALEQLGIGGDRFEGVVTKINEAMSSLDIAGKFKEGADNIEKAGALTNEHFKALANNMGAVLPLVKQIAEGAKGLTFDPLTTAQTKIDAVTAAMKQAAEAGKNAGQVLLQFIVSADKISAIQVGKAFGITDEDVDRIRRLAANGVTVEEIFKRIQGTGVLIGPESAAAFDRMRDSIAQADSAWVRLKQALDSTIFSTLAAQASSALNDIKATAFNTAAAIVEAFNSAASQASAALKSIGQSDFGQAINQQMQNAVTGLNSIIAGMVSSIMQGMGFSQQAIKAVTDQIMGVGQAGQQAGQQAAQGLQLVRDPLTGLVAGAQSAAQATAQAGQTAEQAGQQAGQGFQVWNEELGKAVPAAQQVAQGSTSAFQTMTTAIQGAGTAVADFVSRLGSITWDAISSAGVAAWNALTGAIQSAIDKLLQFIGLKPSAPETGSGAPGKARGGLIGGVGSGTSDSNLAWLSRGEHVMPAHVVRKPGMLSFLEALRRGGGIPGYAEGGPVSRAQFGPIFNQTISILQGAVQTTRALQRTINGMMNGILESINSLGSPFNQGMEAIIQTTRRVQDATNQTMNGIIQSINRVGNPFNQGIETIVQAIVQAANTLQQLNQSKGAARGGLLGGRGTGTSDSNLAWVSRGEYITPARAVRQPGVLAFLEALRRSGGNLSAVLDGMGRFALGGLVPRPAFASGGAVGSMSNVTINFPGLQPISGLRASSAVVDELQRAAALAQVRSGGRKPSRYS